MLANNSAYIAHELQCKKTLMSKEKNFRIDGCSSEKVFKLVPYSKYQSNRLKRT